MGTVIHEFCNCFGSQLDWFPGGSPPGHINIMAGDGAEHQNNTAKGSSHMLPMANCKGAVKQSKLEAHKSLRIKPSLHMSTQTNKQSPKLAASEQACTDFPPCTLNCQHLLHCPNKHFLFFSSSTETFFSFPFPQKLSFLVHFHRALVQGPVLCSTCTHYLCLNCLVLLWRLPVPMQKLTEKHCRHGLVRKLQYSSGEGGKLAAS